MTDTLYRWRGHERPRAGIRASVLPKTDDDGVAEILLYDPIDSWGGDWGVSAKEFAQALTDLDDGVKEIRLRINSPGGEVWEAIAILNSLKTHDARVVAIVDGLAASAASVLACAADETIMRPHSQLMIHDAWGLCVGNAALMRDTGARLDKISDTLAEVYAEKSGETAKTMRKAMLAETWYSAEEAVAAGLADRVEDLEPAADAGADAARFDLTVFAHAGRGDAPAPMLPAASAAGSTPPAAPASGDTTQEGAAAMADITDEQLTTLRQTAGVADDADVDTCLDAIAEALQEQADPPQNSTPPEGTILVDAAAFTELREQAALGVAARAEQIAARRENTLDDAVRTGRISPAARASWAALLERDPAAAETLAGLPAGTIPVDELGHAGYIDSARTDDADAKALAELFPTEV